MFVFGPATSQVESEKGVALGLASLDSSAKVPSSQLPAYVDDVLEYASLSAFPETGESGKIYVATDTSKSYRWSGSTYVELSSYDTATQSAAGLMSATDKAKLDGIAQGANNYSLPTASSTAKGGILIGFTQSEKNYPVQLDSNGKAYVNVPWTDNNTTYSAGTGISLSGTTFSLTSGVVTAGSAGPTADVSGNNSISIPRITVDTYGRVTALSSKTYTGTKDTNTTYSAGTGISLSGTTFSLASGVVTAGSAGPTANVSGANSISVPRITVDTYGRVTALSSKTYTGTTDTWRGIQNNLTSTSTTDSLSAYQGKLLNDNKQDKLPVEILVATGSFSVNTNQPFIFMTKPFTGDGCCGFFAGLGGYDVQRCSGTSADLISATRSGNTYTFKYSGSNCKGILFKYGY